MVAMSFGLESVNFFDGVIFFVLSFLFWMGAQTARAAAGVLRLWVFHLDIVTDSHDYASYLLRRKLWAQGEAVTKPEDPLEKRSGRFYQSLVKSWGVILANYHGHVEMVKTDAKLDVEAGRRLKQRVDEYIEKSKISHQQVQKLAAAYSRTAISFKIEELRQAADRQSGEEKVKTLQKIEQWIAIRAMIHMYKTAQKKNGGKGVRHEKK